MLLEHTIRQLDVGPVPPKIAQRMGELGYIQWLGALPKGVSYAAEAAHAQELASRSEKNSPALAVFCALVEASTQAPAYPLPIRGPEKVRRGGARARRVSL